jgi:hypothetical protein
MIDIPDVYAAQDVLRAAYRAGYAAGTEAAYDNVPCVGDSIHREADWIGRVVTRGNIRAYHAALAALAEAHAREHYRCLPFEPAPSGFLAHGPKGESIGPFATRAEAEEAARDMWGDDWQGAAYIEEPPSAAEMVEAYEAGVTDGIRDAVATYDYDSIAE